MRSIEEKVSTDGYVDAKIDKAVRKEAMHSRIRQDVETKILSGEWGIGHRIPSEHELMAEYKCARMTVNKAIANLVDAGLVTRNRRAGSIVARPQIESAVLQIPDIRSVVESSGATYSYKCVMLERKPSLTQIPNLVQLPKSEVLFVRCLHLSDGMPLVFEDRTIYLSQVPDAMNANFAANPPGSWLLEHVPWTEAEHKITAVSADSAVARELNVATGDACLVVERKTWRSGEIITEVRQIFRGDRYHLVARFLPSQS
ncbi:MAG: histidine utilization repressor [Allorhizobium sp.]